MSATLSRSTMSHALCTVTSRFLWSIRSWTVLITVSAAMRKKPPGPTQMKDRMVPLMWSVTHRIGRPERQVAFSLPQARMLRKSEMPHTRFFSMRRLMVLVPRSRQSKCHRHKKKGSSKQKSDRQESKTRAHRSKQLPWQPLKSNQPQQHFGPQGLVCSSMAGSNRLSSTTSSSSSLSYDTRYSLPPDLGSSCARPSRPEFLRL
mmetsp:Transcript_67921/g.189691  ORF Transcript_67921/g.189691 Transcript_67921/m.189691 type:complete len:204 (-) Transcript_67921:1375-1986(-)